MNTIQDLLWSVAIFTIIAILIFVVAQAKGQNVTYQSVLAEKPVDLKRMASALKAVENTPRDYVGDAGERSEFQITPDVWNQHSHMPHEWGGGSDPVCVDETLKVVRKHLDWIVATLMKNRYTASPYTVALVWKAGWGRFSRHQERFSDTSYGQRVMAVYDETSK